MLTHKHRNLSLGLLTSLLALSALVTGPSTASAVAPTPAAFTPVAPCKVLDTRTAAPGRLAAAQAVTIQVTGSCGVSAQASSVMVSVAALNTATSGYAVGWDGTSPQPATSVLNWDPKSKIAGAAVLPLSASGSIKLLVSSPTDLLVSVLGFYSPAPGPVSAGRYVPSTPARLYNSRDTARPAPGSVVTVPLPGVPTSASAVAVTLTTTLTLGQDWLGVAAGGTTPTVSVLNVDAPGQTRAVYTVVPVGPGGISVVSNAGNHIIVDLVGYYTGSVATAPSSTGLFVSIPPTRLTDTRSSGPQLYPSGIRAWSTSAIAPAASAVLATITTARTNKAGYATLYAAGTPTPVTSSVNASHSWQSIANLASPSVSTAGVAVTASMGTDIIVDVYGYFTGSPVAATDTLENNPVPVVTTSGPVVDGSCTPAGAAVSVDEFNKVWTATGSTSPLWRTVTYPRAGWRGPIAVIGDSLTLQSATETVVALRNAGYGPICVDAAVNRVATGSGLARVNALKATSTWGNSNVRWVIALGTTDTTLTATQNTMASWQRQLNTALGARWQPTSWVNLKSKRAGDLPTREAAWNTALASNGFRVINWSSSAPTNWIISGQADLTAAGILGRAGLLATNA